ncbi:MAG TPA: hypothetical protein DCS07_04365 [Bdellovibrionales bacterium]|nr:hypothetical protein [Bdellovibrionales bacterium]HCM39250.1 hypothetical protein [Bdellovibrionales bacterium]
MRNAAFQYMGLTREQLLLGSVTVLGFGGVFLSKIAPVVISLGWKKFKSIFVTRPENAIQLGALIIPDEARLRHTHIVGATGSGKTVLIEQLLFHDLARGHGAIVIDPKGDRELYGRIRHFVGTIGRASDLHLLSAAHIEESAIWNPCRLGNASELQSKFLNSAVYDNPFYAKACELALRRAFDNLALRKSGSFTLLDLVHELEQAAKASGEETIKGLYFDLYNLALSDWAPIFGTDQSTRAGKGEISLLDITRKNEILFVDLPTEAKTTESQRIGRLILQEVMLLSGMRKLYPNIRNATPFSIYVDEFDAFASQAFATFLNKGRSSGFMIHMAHQTLSDLKLISDTFAGQIMGNTNVRFIFRQDDPDDAETWARFFGTSRVIKGTFQTKDGAQTGMSSNREVQEFRIGPDTIKDLGVGECVFSLKTGRKLEKFLVPGPGRFQIPTAKLPQLWGPLPGLATRKASLKRSTPYKQINEHVQSVKSKNEEVSP